MEHKRLIDELNRVDWSLLFYEIEENYILLGQLKDVKRTLDWINENNKNKNLLVEDKDITFYRGC